MAAQGLIHLHRSNRTEVLAAELARILKQDPLAPMEQDWVVVQGPGMQRWLSIELAKELGVWANARFPFPRYLIDTAMREVLGYSAAEESALQPGPLLWAVVQELTRLQSDKQFAEIRHYLQDHEGDGGHERKLFQLAERVAKILDRYTIYRPQLLSEWEAGKNDGWQSTLWRALTHNYDRRHPGAMLVGFLNEVGQHSEAMASMPRRVCLFGISSLPPVYMRVLSALASRVELHLFVLSPSRQYWADLRHRGRREEPELDEGNALLASLGRLSGDFQQVLEDNAEYQETGEDLYRLPDASRGMLATVQADILELRNRRPLAAGAEPDQSKPLPLAIANDDRTIAIHSCHSPMREVEVLHDQIVAILETDSSLEARDLVVMTPDIETYAPLVDAVFASDKNDRPRIPYRIADRSDRSSYPVLQAMSQILTTLGGRMTATEVLDLLALEVVAARFELKEDDLALIRDWVRESGVRWGVDAEHRASVDQPALAENTWRFGLDRLLLGYAMEGKENDLFGGVLPFDDMEGNDTQVLGRFLEFTSSLFRFRDLFLRPATLASWSSSVSVLLATMVQADEGNLAEHRLVRDSIETLVSDSERVGFSELLSFTTLSDLLQKRWQEGEAARGFLSGGVTFCQLMPMRSIPFRVVCVLGMSDGAFPRSVHPLGFDRMASEPKTGDRTPRDDDRYLFLEAILAARDSLLISYVGRSIHNNAAIPPSVLVGELLDLLTDSFTVEEGSVMNRVLVHHPLQPFSPSYFGRSADPRLFSYSKAYGQGALSLAGDTGPRKSFLSGPLPLEEDLEPALTIDELSRFFANPTEYLLQQRLGLFIRDEDSSQQDREPLALTGLDGWRVGEGLLQRTLRGEAPADAYDSVRASGTLPLGAVGQCSYDDLQRAVSRLSERAGQFMEGQPLESLFFDQSVAGTRVTGNLDNLWPEGRVRVAYRRLGKYAELGQWIRHLCLCLMAPEGYAKRTILVGRADRGPALHSVFFETVAEPQALLEPFVKLYWAGQVAPLPFFPQSAREFANKLKGAALSDLNAQELRVALEAAARIYRGNTQYPGESADPYISHVYEDASCLERDYLPFASVPKNYESFPVMASRLFGPLLAARGKTIL